MSLLSRKYFAYYFLFIVVLISRLPFLSAGYGVEEDSWGIALAGFHTRATGIYEPSRFPGHPVHEYIYSAFYGHSPFFYNFFSAFFSAIAAVTFAAILKRLNFRYPFLAAMALAFTPAVYISSTYTIDFCWTLAFLLISFYFLLKEYYIFCGIFLGLAIGCRITMGAMLLPFIMILWGPQNNLRNTLKLFVPMAIVTVLVFLPLIREFGTSFFMYYDQFPYPPMTKVLYKMVIGVFGALGTAALIVCAFVLFFRKLRSTGKLFRQPLRGRIIAASFLVIILFVISYFRLPQKSGYMITTIPFLILLAGYYLDGKWFIILCFSLILSPFVFSINLTDKLRGAEYSRFAVKFRISGQEIFFDPLSGPVFSDHSKRKQKQNYVANVIHAADHVSDRTVIIAGWWYNEIMMEIRDSDPEDRFVRFVPYIDEAQLRRYADRGCRIKYLPEQDIYNDQMFGIHSTREFAAEF